MPDFSDVIGKVSWTPHGVIAVDKHGDQILFLDPSSLEAVSSIGNMPNLPHELAISPDRSLAFVPAYGDGAHGDNPHPNHWVSVIDLHHRERLENIDISPLESPHTLRFGGDKRLYICCENSGEIAICDPHERRIIGTIPTASRNSHRLTILSRRGLICTDNEEDATISILDIASRDRIGEIALPCAIAGIDASPDETLLIVSSAERPEALVIDLEHQDVVRTVPLSGHSKSVQVVRYSPDGRWLLIVGDQEPVISLLTADLSFQKTLKVGIKPMDGAFHPNGSTLLIANEGNATLSEIDLHTLDVSRTVPCGKGVETLAFF